MVNTSLVKIAFIVGIFVQFPIYTMETNNILLRTVDEWLDPKLKSKKRKVLEVLRDFDSKGKIEIPQKSTNEDFGFSFRPHSSFDYMCLSHIHDIKIESTQRVSFVDLGCGLGQMSTMAVFAGARVDAVDFYEVLVKAESTIIDKIQIVIGYKSREIEDYFRALPGSILSLNANSWTQTKHDVALCSNVLHFFTGSEVIQFAYRIFDNLNRNGYLFVKTDSPFFSEGCYEFYKSQRDNANSSFPGLAVCNRQRGVDFITRIGRPVAYDEKTHSIRPGQRYAGEFTEYGFALNNTNCCHDVSNYFLVEELVKIFENVGFHTIDKFYLTHDGITLHEDDELPAIGRASKACAIFVKL